MNPEKDAIGKLWDEATPKLYGYLINTLKDRALADDILQNTWLKALEAMPSYRDRGYFSAWLFSIAKNEMRMHWRRHGREIPYQADLHDRAEEKNPEGKIFMEQIISRLHPEDQELVRLRYIGDLPLGEIAKILNLNPVTVRVRMHRVLKNVRNLINNQPYA